MSFSSSVTSTGEKTRQRAEVFSRSPWGAGASPVGPKWRSLSDKKDVGRDVGTGLVELAKSRLGGVPVRAADSHKGCPYTEP